MASSSGSLPSLEKDLGLLLTALHNNKQSDDTWEGKPSQQSFRVYSPQSQQQISPQTFPLYADANKSDGDFVENPSPSDAQQTGRETSERAPVEGKEEKGDGQGSLDALMRAYVTAVQGLRVSEAASAAHHSLSPKTVVQQEEAEARQPRAAAPLDDAASRDNAWKDGAAADVDMQSLLDALDNLPPLSKEEKAP